LERLPSAGPGRGVDRKPQRPGQRVEGRVFLLGAEAGRGVEAQVERLGLACPALDLPGDLQLLAGLGQGRGGAQGHRLGGGNGFTNRNGLCCKSKRNRAGQLNIKIFMVDL
jgi:hypothetical protein